MKLYFKDTLKRKILGLRKKFSTFILKREILNIEGEMAK